ncbi:MAG: 4-hydroxythreonine-4-phosphate dehydrogenase PdxA [Rhodomicrobium sp.]|nr:4-hydroxythreonine-4-phosphate dehydrogenase PdxA [Rhodomicrobium sp.]
MSFAITASLDPADKPLAVTMGDPAGIGPDTVLMAWSRRLHDTFPVFFAVGDPQVFAERAAMLPAALALQVETIAQPEEAHAVFAHALPVLPLKKPCGFITAGKPDSANAAAIIESIEEAVALTIAGRASALVTSPIAKYVLLQQGFRHAGHTEFLAELAARHRYAGTFPVMLMASRRLMVVPVTVHIALKDVPSTLTQARLIRTAEVTNDGLRRYFGIEQPRLAICGLNPHAGENGELGREEIDLIAPAIDQLKSQGIHATGPHSADTLFHDAARASYDAVLAMYHDQALIPFKTLAFEDGVNVTLGLPFIRTSPDHGTAFALAGTGQANPTSFIEALRLASRMHRTASAAASLSRP